VYFVLTIRIVIHINYGIFMSFMTNKLDVHVTMEMTE